MNQIICDLQMKSSEEYWVEAEWRRKHSAFNQVDPSLKVLVEAAMSKADSSYLPALWWGDKTWA